jgi:betaine-aldehyde dehydrogenase
MADKQILANIIDGEDRPAASSDVLDIINPSIGEVYATAPNSGPEDVDAAFQAAAAAFESYRWKTPGERQRFLLKLADLIEANAEELVRIESRTPASHSQ